jgi:hypothetical protein
MSTAEAIEARLLATVRDPVNGYVLSGDGRIADRDVPRLLGMSPRAARELRESGDAWPRYGGLPIAGCLYSVFLAELAQWAADRLTDAS